MSPRESERDRVRRVLTDKYGASVVSEEMVDATIQAIAHGWDRQLAAPPTLLDAARLAQEIAAGPDGLSDEGLREALKDVAQDIKSAKARRVRLVAAAARREWSLRDIAPLLGKSHGTVANILKGRDAG